MTEREFSVYAIVRCGGRQEKAAVDDVLTVDTLAGEIGSSVTMVLSWAALKARKHLSINQCR